MCDHKVCPSVQKGRFKYSNIGITHLLEITACVITNYKMCPSVQEGRFKYSNIGITHLLEITACVITNYKMCPSVQKGRFKYSNIGITHWKSQLQSAGFLTARTTPVQQRFANTLVGLLTTMRLLNTVKSLRLSL